MMQNSHFIVKIRREEGPEGELAIFHSPWEAPGCTKPLQEKGLGLLKEAPAS